jgi:hypothetical protein
LWSSKHKGNMVFIIPIESCPGDSVLPFICSQQYTEKNMQTCCSARFQLTPHAPHCESESYILQKKETEPYLSSSRLTHVFVPLPTLLFVTMALGNCNTQRLSENNNSRWRNYLVHK